MPLADPGLLGLARQSLPLGEIRIGTSKEVPGKRGRQPVRLEAFRFTTPSQETAVMVAELYGGTPAPWERRRGYFEVITERSQIDVWVPPRGRAVDTNMEMWGGSPAKCLRRCDGRTERRSGQPCMCPRPDDPADPDDVERAYCERLRLAKLNPPQACKVRTRYNLEIPDLPGLIGVWKLNTGSANAARWSADSGDVLERARAAEVFMPASLEITWWPGQEGNPYPVPILRPKQSITQMAAGELPSGLNGLLAQLQPGGGQRAITSAAGDTAIADAELLTDEDDIRRKRAQDIANRAWTMPPAELKEIRRQLGEDQELADEYVSGPDDGSSEPLGPFLEYVWNEQVRASQRRRSQAQMPA